MTNYNLIRTDIVRLLVDNVAPDFNFEDQLWFIARADPQEALEYLHLLLRTQFIVRARQDGESFFHDCSIDHLGTFSRVVAPYAKEIARRALILRDARQRLQNDPRPFPFLQLPLEIRLQVYNYAFANTRTVKLDRHESFERLQDWECFYLAYDIVVQAGKNEFGIDIDTALLLTNRQIFDEAEPILYQTRFIQIGVYLHKGLEFLESLSPRARRNIRVVHITLPHRCICGLGIDHSLQYWCKLCAYMSQNLHLRTLSFNVSVKAIPANFADEAWVKDLIKIRELERLVQGDFRFVDASTEVTPYSDDGSDSEPEPRPHKALISRRQALLDYLRSKMCQLPASRVLIGIDEEWIWRGNPRQDWVEDDGHGWS